MAHDNTLPSDEERRAYMRKLKTFRESLSPREQRLLDATVLASFWPADSAEVEGYRLLPIDSIYDEGRTIPTLNDSTPWVKFFTIA